MEREDLEAGSRSMRNENANEKSEMPERGNANPRVTHEILPKNNLDPHLGCFRHLISNALGSRLQIASSHRKARARVRLCGTQTRLLVPKSRHGGKE